VLKITLYHTNSSNKTPFSKPIDALYNPSLHVKSAPNPNQSKSSITFEQINDLLRNEEIPLSTSKSKTTDDQRNKILKEIL